MLDEFIYQIYYVFMSSRYSKHTYCNKYYYWVGALNEMLRSLKPLYDQDDNKYFTLTLVIRTPSVH